MKLSRRRIFATVSALFLTAAATGCVQFGRSYRQEVETSQYIGTSVRRSGDNENAAGRHMTRSFQEDVAPWGFWDSLSRGWSSDLEHWSK